jgi:hypothetical protein
MDGAPATLTKEARSKIEDLCRIGILQLSPLPIQLASYRIEGLLPAVLSRKHFLPETL